MKAGSARFSLARIESHVSSGQGDDPVTTFCDASSLRGRAMRHCKDDMLDAPQEHKEEQVTRWIDAALNAKLCKCRRTPGVTSTSCDRTQRASEAHENGQRDGPHDELRSG